MDKDYTWGKHLRDLRLAHGLTIYELAKQADIDFTYLSKIECDKVEPPSSKVIFRLAHALDQSGSEMLYMAGKVLPRKLRGALKEYPELTIVLQAIQSGILTDEQIKTMVEVIKHG